MDFLDPKKKRAHSIRLLVGYFLMAIAIAIGTLILLLEAFGYDLYNTNGQVIQNGLMFIENKPQPAEIIVNGKPEGRTGKRLVLPEGNYDVQLRRDGYREWRRQLRLRGHIVERLTYPLLIPEELTTETQKTYLAPPPLATQSPDRRWLIVMQPGSNTRFEAIDLNDPEVLPAPFEIPETLFSRTGKVHKYSVVEWSNDNRHVLLRHDFEGGYEFAVLDWREPELSFNVDVLFNLPIKNVTLRDKKFDQLHLLDNSGNLWHGEAPAGRLTPLARQVISYKSHGTDVILFSTNQAAKKDESLVYVLKGGQSYLLRRLPRDSQFVLDLARFDDKWYLALGSVKDERAFVYRDPFELLEAANDSLPAPVAVLKLDNQVTSLSFSANTRFIGAQSGSEFAIYDAEHERQYRFDTELKLPKGYKAAWMDGHRYAVVSEGQVVMFDFDGSNQQQLIGSRPEFLPFFDRDYENLYTLAPGGSGSRQTVLQITSLLTEQDR